MISHLPIKDILIKEDFMYSSPMISSLSNILKYIWAKDRSSEIGEFDNSFMNSNLLTTFKNSLTNDINFKKIFSSILKTISNEKRLDNYSDKFKIKCQILNECEACKSKHTSDTILNLIVIPPTKNVFFYDVC
jgi:hypothetical protein